LSAWFLFSGDLSTNVYIFHIKPHFSIIVFYCEVISKRILIIFAPEEAEIFKNDLFISV
jgi:hypothetical protein